MEHSYLKEKYEELGLPYGEAVYVDSLTDDELQAYWYLRSGKEVPVELKEKIISLKTWNIPLVSLFFDEEVENQTHRLIGRGKRSYLKMNDVVEERDKLNELRTKFLEQWGVSENYLPLDLIEISDELYQKMKEQVVEFTGYITLADVEKFVKGKSNFLKETDLDEREELVNEIINKLVEANILNRNAETFELIRNDIMKKFRFLPIENLNNLVKADYKWNSTIAEWFEEQKKQGFLEFLPYLYEEDGECFIVLAYDTYFMYSKENKLQLVSTAGSVSADRDSMNDEVHKFISKMLEKISRTKIDSTQLLQVLFYMSVINTGMLSKKFQDSLSNKKISLDEFVKTSGESNLFDEFNFKFMDFVPYLQRYRADDFFVKQSEQWIWFRVPANDSDYDLCRIGIGSSLKAIMEYKNRNNGNQEFITVNLEHLLDRLYCLSLEEKEQVLKDSNIGRVLVTFMLSLNHINMTKTDIYTISAEEPNLIPKQEENLPILYDSMDLDYRVFEKRKNLQSNVSRPIEVPQRPNLPIGVLSAPPIPSVQGIGVPPMPPVQGIGVPPMPPAQVLGMPPMTRPTPPSEFGFIEK